MKNGKTIPIIDENKRNSGNTRKTDFPKMRERLEKLRKENGYTQEQVAKKIACCPRAYRSWITGKYDAKTNTQQYAVPSLENLINLSALYNVSCELKVCTTKKPENPSVFLTLPVAHELSVLCMI